MARVVIFLFCLVIFLVVDKSVGRRDITPCKTDNTCGDKAVMESHDGQEFCCSEGSRIRIRPGRGATGETKCKCVTRGAGGGGRRGNGRRPEGGRPEGGRPNRRRPNRPMRCNFQNDCGEGAVTGTANERPVCCPAGYLVTNESVTRRGRTRERCSCQMPS